MAEVSPNTVAQRRYLAKLRAGAVAGQQWGVIDGRQLRDCGVSEGRARRWRTDGTLHRLWGTVFTFGHASVPPEGLLTAALLYAGEGSALSHATAAWWWGLIDEEPPVIEVSASHRRRSLERVKVHQRTHFEHRRHRRFPITSVAQTLLDYSAGADLLSVRQALARADYLRLLDRRALDTLIGQGKAGSARLRGALGRHEPALARTRSRLEAEFIPLCESAGLPLPEINVRVGRWTVDAVWRAEQVVVELDGYANHSTRAQIERDRRKELELRALGFVVIRYSRDQVVHQSGLVAADLSTTLAARTAPSRP